MNKIKVVEDTGEITDVLEGQLVKGPCTVLSRIKTYLASDEIVFRFKDGPKSKDGTPTKHVEYLESDEHHVSMLWSRDAPKSLKDFKDDVIERTIMARLSVVCHSGTVMFKDDKVLEVLNAVREALLQKAEALYRSESRAPRKQDVADKKE